jgi:hypothetical protein
MPNFAKNCKPKTVTKSQIAKLKFYPFALKTDKRGEEKRQQFVDQLQSEL